MAVTRRPCAKCGRNRAEKFYVSAKGRVCATCRKRRRGGAAREVHLMETHYITADEYDLLLADQGGTCWICEGERPYNLDVDHSHAVERELLSRGYPKGIAHRWSIRGLLCKTCNRRLLPACKDDSRILGRAIDYLDRWPHSTVLNPKQTSRMGP